MNRLLPLALLAGLVALPLGLGASPYLLNALVVTGILTIGAMSLNLLLGFTGQLSLGHIAFFGIGAYVSALTSLGFDVDLGFGIRVVHEPWPAVVGLLLATAAAGACGYLIGRLSFRVRGAYFVIVTISFAEVVRLVALNWVELTQGPLALTNIPAITLGLPGLGMWTLKTKLQNYYLVLAVGTLCSLSAHYLRIIDPDVFLFATTVSMVIMVVAGGKGTLMGPVVGGLIFGLLPVALRPVMAPEAQWIVYGLVLIVILFVMPRGIVPGLAALLGRRPAPAAPVLEANPAVQR